MVDAGLALQLQNCKTLILLVYKHRGCSLSLENHETFFENGKKKY